MSLLANSIAIVFEVCNKRVEHVFACTEGRGGVAMDVTRLRGGLLSLYQKLTWALKDMTTLGLLCCVFVVASNL